MKLKKVNRLNYYLNSDNTFNVLTDAITHRNSWVLFQSINDVFKVRKQDMNPIEPIAITLMLKRAIQ